MYLGCFTGDSMPYLLPCLCRCTQSGDKTTKQAVVAIGEAKTENMIDLGYDLVFNINMVLAVFDEGGEAAVLDFAKGSPYLGNVRRL